MEELLAKAVTIDDRKVPSFLLGNERVDEVEVSKVPDKHSVSVARYVQVGGFNQGGSL